MFCRRWSLPPLDSRCTSKQRYSISVNAVSQLHTRVCDCDLSVATCTPGYHRRRPGFPSTVIARAHRTIKLTTIGVQCTDAHRARKRFTHGAFPLRSPLLGEAVFVSFPPRNDMLKSRGLPTNMPTPKAESRAAHQQVSLSHSRYKEPARNVMACRLLPARTPRTQCLNPGTNGYEFPVDVSSSRRRPPN